MTKDDKIKEIIQKIYRMENASYQQAMCYVSKDSANSKKYGAECESLHSEIESALRELVERKPLDDQYVRSLGELHVGLDASDSTLQDFARAVERAHGIGA